jgi:hypothetical protein
MISIIRASCDLALLGEPNPISRCPCHICNKHLYVVLSDVIDTFGIDKSRWFCKTAVVISSPVVTGQTGAKP